MKKSRFPLGFISLSIFLFLCFTATAQEQFKPRFISGTVTFENNPLVDVNVKVEGSSRGTRTDGKGLYELKVRTGEVIEFSHVGFETVVVIVEDITSTLNLEMVQQTNTLGTAIVRAKRKWENPRVIKEEIVMNIDLQIAGRTINPFKSGFSTTYLPKYLFDNGLPLALTLNGKAAGLSSDGEKVYIRGGEATWFVDGVETPLELVPDPVVIHDMYLLKALGIIYVRTIYSPDVVAQQREDVAEEYRNQNYYEEDAVAVKSDLTSRQQNVRKKIKPYGPLKKIKGIITYLEAPLADVNIHVEGSSRGIQTNRRGKYQIEARAGEVLVYSHLGFKTITIIVEDVTEEISLEMVPEANELDEVLVTATLNDGKVVSYTKKAEASYQTSRGTFDPKKSGFANAYYDGDDINPASTDILEVIAGKFASVRVNLITREIRVRMGTGSILNDVPPIWEIDGLVMEGIPIIDPQNIKDIRILKSLGATTRYGSVAAGGVIVISTKSGDYQPSAGSKNGTSEEYANQNFYNNDAVQAQGNVLVMTSAVKLREQLTIETHPERLKALAFQFQALDLKKDAIEAYKKVFRVRPGYAQSYRDLANAYVENENFRQGWRMYMAFLNQGFNADEEGIGEMVFDEMEWLYFGRRNQTEIRQNFQPKSEDIYDFRNDARFVFEWNTSEAEFDLEFVSPDRRSYVFEHTLTGNQALLNDEKRKGYSSKSFFVDDIDDGEWLVNLTYKGNKKDAPTYFKLTTYYNWGSATQWQETRVYKLDDSQRQKLQLVRLNKQLLLAAR